MSLTNETLEHWNSALSKAIAKVGSSDFPGLLVQSLRQLLDFDVCMIFAYGADTGSVALFHTMHGAQAKLLVDDYLLGPHLLDPFYSAAIDGRNSRFGSMRELAPDQFYRSEFYRHHYIQTGIADEIGLFFPVEHNRTAVLSVTRQKPKRLFTETEKRRFKSAAAIVGSLGSSHWGATRQRQVQSVFTSTIDTIFEQFGNDVLTFRERQIVALILKGHSSLSIGNALEISTGTVKNHRKHIYGKLQISSQAELFALFLEKLEKGLQ